MRNTSSRAMPALILAAGLSGSIAAQAATAPAAPASAASQPANLVRPEFAKQFTAAQDLIKAGKGPEALAKLKDAEAVGNLSPFEQYLVVRVRAPAEFTAGDLASATKDFETVLASDQLPPADRAPIMKALAEITYNDKQYAKSADWMQRYFAAGGQDAQLRELLPQTLYITKDFPGAAKAFSAFVASQVAAGQKPAEKTLRLLASAQTQAGDDAGYVTTLEMLAVDYPKADYWKELISRASRVEKLNDRQYVDVYRLKAAAYGEVADSERLSYADLALHAGFPAEAKRVLDDGLAKKAFTGTEPAEAAKLSAQANRAAALDKSQASVNEASARAARDGNIAVSLGTLEAMAGDPAHGVELLQLGIAKGGLKAPDEATLHLGIAQYRAGRDADALKTLQSVTAGGVGALAHVWTLIVQARMQAATAPAAAAN